MKRGLQVLAALVGFVLVLGFGVRAIAVDGGTAVPCTLTDVESGQQLVCDLPPAPTVFVTTEVPGPTPATPPTPPASTITLPPVVETTTIYTTSPTPTPTPSPSPSQSPSPTLSPTPTVTPSSTPTPTPTPTATPTAVPGAWPGPGNTGVPPGTVLRLVKRGDSGNGWSVDTGTNATFNITQAGKIIDGFDIPFVVRAVANNITIKNSRIRASGYYTVKGFDPPTDFSGLTIMDTEIDGLNGLGVPGIAVATGSNATYLRLNIHGFGSSGPRMTAGSLMQDTWIHSFVCAPNEHSAGSSANGGGTNIRWLHNNVSVLDAQGNKTKCASNALSIYADFAPASAYNGVQMIGNLLAGGAYGLYALQNQGARGVRVENNVFDCTSFVYGPVNQIQPNAALGNTFSGNKCTNGTPIN